MSLIDTRLLRRGNVLAFGPTEGCSLLTSEGAFTIPEPLATLVRQAIEQENTDV